MRGFSARSLRSGLRVASIIAALTLVGASNLAIAPSARAASVAPASSKVMANASPVLSGYLWVYQDTHYGGRVLPEPFMCDSWGECYFSLYTNDLRNQPGPCWTWGFGLGGNWNDCISSVDIWNYSGSPYNVCITAYTDPNYGGFPQTWKVLRGQELSFPTVWYNDSISSLDIEIC
jgi:hypothetical protein